MDILKLFMAGVFRAFSLFGIIAMIMLGFVTFVAIFGGFFMMCADFIGVFKADARVFYWWPWWCVGFVVEFIFFHFFTWVIYKTDPDELDQEYLLRRLIRNQVRL